MRGPITHAEVLLLFTALLLAAPGLAAVFKVQFTPVSEGSAVGSVLVLDVSSLWQKHPAQSPYSVTTPSECQQRCAQLPGCNAYRFCSKQNGCGTGCLAYTTLNRPLKAAARSRVRRTGGDDDAVAYELKPVLSFGAFRANRATQGCHPANTDKWAFGTCTLLSAKQKGNTTPAAQGAGWSSAWLAQPLPTQCNGLSASACAACYSTPNPGVCLKCMMDGRAAAQRTDITLISDGVPPASTGGRTLDQCVTCAQLSTKAQQDKCTACVLDSQPCGACVSYPGAATQVKVSAMAGCVECVQSRGKRFTGTCQTCATTPNPSQCYECLGRFYPRLTCKTSAYEDCYKPDFDNPCATCQQGSPQAYTSCVACYMSPASKPDCDTCNLLSTTAAQQQCYACSKALPPTRSDFAGGCGLCFAQSRDQAAQQQCLSCVTNKLVLADNRQHCSLCSSPDLNSVQASRCFKCLSTPAASSACSVCSRTTNSDAAFNSCMVCYNRPDNGPDCDDCTNLEVAGGPAAWDVARKKCFDCVTASKLVAPPDAGFAPLGCCSACFASGMDTDMCVACNTSPATSMAAKMWCSSCSSSASAGKRATCIKCLQSSKPESADGYMAKCNL